MYEQQNFFTESPSHRETSSFKTEKPEIDNKQKGRGRRRKNVIYPIFEEAANYADDSFWNEKLLDAARGSFHSKNVKFEKGHLIYDTKRKTDAVLMNGTPEEVANKFCVFMRMYTDLSSDDDKRRMDMQMELAYIERKEKPMSKKELWSILVIFVEEFAKANNLNPNSKKMLYNTITLGYRLGIIHGGTVFITNGRIVNINDIRGIVFDYYTGSFYLNKDAVNETRKMLTREITYDTSVRKHEMYNPKGKSSKKEWDYMVKCLNATGELQEEMLLT